MDHTDIKLLLSEINELKTTLAQINKYRFADQYLTNQEFCTLLNITPKTALFWRQSNQIPYAQFGKKIFYRLTDVEAIFEREFNKPKHTPKRTRLRNKKLILHANTNGWDIIV